MGRWCGRWCSSADGKRVATATERLDKQHQLDPRITVWEVDTGRMLRRFLEPDGQTFGLALSGDGTRLVTSVKSGGLRVRMVPGP